MPRLSVALLVCVLAPALAACSAGEDDAAVAAEAPADVRRDLLEVPDRGEASVRADLDLGLGTVTVGEAEAGTLFQAEVALPVDGLRPTFETETARNSPRPKCPR